MHLISSLDLHNLVPHLLANASSIISGSAKDACGSGCNTHLTVADVFSNITNILVYIIGSISVIMIVVGGLRYVLSNGDPKGAESARNTILYAVIGIAISIAAYAIVHFVVANFK